MASPVLTCQAVREVDRLAVTEYGMIGLVLMENAGRGCADVLCHVDRAGPVVICCGRGNNGGDGLVLARHLDLRGLDVRVLFWADPQGLRGDARVNWEIASRAGIPIHVLQGAHDAGRLAQHLADARWIVDALLGTGTRGAPRPPLDQVIRQLNQHPAKKLAIDIPSGLDCELGRPAEPTFRADHTCTFVAAKPGLVGSGGRAPVGTLHVLDIGAPRKLLMRFGLSGDYSEAIVGGS